MINGVGAYVVWTHFLQDFPRGFLRNDQIESLEIGLFQAGMDGGQNAFDGGRAMARATVNQNQIGKVHAHFQYTSAGNFVGLEGAKGQFCRKCLRRELQGLTDGGKIATDVLGKGLQIGRWLAEQWARTL